MITVINCSVDSNLSCLARRQSPLQARQVSPASWTLPQVASVARVARIAELAGVVCNVASGYLSFQLRHLYVILGLFLFVVLLML